MVNNGGQLLGVKMQGQAKMESDSSSEVMMVDLWDPCYYYKARGRVEIFQGSEKDGNIPEGAKKTLRKESYRG